MSCRRFFPALILLLFSLFPLAGLGQDTDGDGMPDAWEQTYPCVDYLVGDSQLDPDGEGLTNLQEYQNSANPCSIDTDGDGLDDLMGGFYLSHRPCRL